MIYINRLLVKQRPENILRNCIRYDLTAAIPRQRQGRSPCVLTSIRWTEATWSKRVSAAGGAILGCRNRTTKRLSADPNVPLVRFQYRNNAEIRISRSSGAAVANCIRRADAGRLPQPRSAAAPPDGYRPALRPLAAGFFGVLGADRALHRPLEASDIPLGPQMVTGGVRRPRSSRPRHLNQPDIRRPRAVCPQAAPVSAPQQNFSSVHA